MTTDERFEIILQSLQKSFGAKQLLVTDEVAPIYNLKTKTMYNQVSDRTFPVKPVRANGRPRWRLVDIAKHLSELESE